MATANYINKDEQTPQEPARVAEDTETTKSEALNIPRPNLGRKGQHLDVDGVLARSLPKTISQ